MPAEMSRSWLLAGIVGVFVVLTVSLLLPLPGRNAGLVSVPKFLTSSQSLSSQSFGWGDEGTESQDNAHAARTHDPAGPQDGPASEEASESSSDQSSEDGTSSTPAESEEAKSADASSEAGDKSSQPSQSRQEDAARSTKEPQQKQAKSGSDAKHARSEQNEPSQQTSSEGKPSSAADQRTEAANETESQAQPQEASQETTRGSSSQGPLGGLARWLGASVAEWLKWLTIILLAAIVLLYAVTHPRELIELWRGFWRWWQSLFSRPRHRSNRPAIPASIKQSSEQRVRGFHEFQNPFAVHLQGWSPSHVIEHTFAALEAWAREAGVQRASDQTSGEFVRRISQAHPAIGRDAVLAAAMLDRLLFAGWRPSQSEVESLEQLWRLMQKGRETVPMQRS